MQVKAELNYLRIAPRKARLVANLIRGQSVEKAQTTLNFVIKKGATPLLKLLKSAIANAKNNFQIEESNLFISQILVDEGPKYKRWMPRARGSASEIQKKTSHITLILNEIKKGAKKAKKTKKTEGEIKKIEEDVEKVEKEKIEKPRFKPEEVVKKPRIEKGLRRIFRRKAF